VPKKDTDNAKIYSNETDQTNWYIGGTGFTYQRYDITNLSSKTLTSFKTVESGSPNITLVETSKRATLKSK
jgi:hypothetical protein